MYLLVSLSIWWLLWNFRSFPWFPAFPAIPENRPGLKICYPEYFQKSCFEDLKFLTEHPWNFTENVIRTKNFQVYSLQSIPILRISNCPHTEKFETLESCFNTFHPLDSFFIICKFTISYLIIFSLYILWITFDEFSPWQCIVFCLISSQERANIIVFDSKSVIKNQLKNKQAKSIFY